MTLNPFAFIPRFLRRRERNKDREFLWPEIYDGTTVEKARAAIDLHISRDPAWRYPEEWRGEAVYLLDEGVRE